MVEITLLLNSDVGETFVSLSEASLWGRSVGDEGASVVGLRAKCVNIDFLLCSVDSDLA
jgi:hypothetical protein